uniref:Uncharacterized protein n=1 Tax=Arundo donax TaxID=35708 RepID=A0A0A9G1U1_ARUDO
MPLFFNISLTVTRFNFRSNAICWDFSMTDELPTGIYHSVWYSLGLFIWSNKINLILIIKVAQTSGWKAKRWAESLGTSTD